MNNKPNIYTNRLLPFLLLAIVSLRCTTATNNTDQTSAAFTKYARGFTVQQVGESKLVEVKYPYQNATSGYTYLLVPKGKIAPAHGPDTQVIYTPIERIVCTSATHIPL
ncbi:MAG: hypothetical protein ACKOE6_14695, partial [Flammeovirgaceae bacterium]